MFFAASPAFGSTIIAITGNQGTYENGDTSEWSAQAWTQTGTYTGVIIKATVFQELIGTPNGDGFAGANLPIYYSAKRCYSLF